MDLFYFATSINKISLIAFIITVGFVGYEFYLLKKEHKTGRKVDIPQFDGKNGALLVDQNQTSSLKTASLSSKNYIFIGVLILFLIIFGVLTILGFINLRSAKIASSSPYPTPVVGYASSRGIKILDGNFQPVSDKDLSKIHLGDKLIIGVETINEADIDMARIRVNKGKWTGGDVTTRFDKVNNIFYIDYMVATGTAYLKVQAELHSKNDGWLGEQSL